MTLDPIHLGIRALLSDDAGDKRLLAYCGRLPGDATHLQPQDPMHREWRTRHGYTFLLDAPNAEVIVCNACLLAWKARQTERALLPDGPDDPL